MLTISEVRTMVDTEIAGRMERDGEYSVDAVRTYIVHEVMAAGGIDAEEAAERIIKQVAAEIARHRKLDGQRETETVRTEDGERLAKPIGQMTLFELRDDVRHRGAKHAGDGIELRRRQAVLAEAIRRADAADRDHRVTTVGQLIEAAEIKSIWKLAAA